ncbi:FMN-binding protein [Sedimentibacter sp. B4]|uniref:FMN-binding protein n=1 Tax=Sedimentibacter sp. B4 TaxID=304766 RepID=UPI0002DF17C9|nr:FMN-binding protein [Sedimentibacter sp. B4]
MKKIALILCVMIIMSLGLVACADNNGNNTGNTDNNTGNTDNNTGTNGTGTNGTGTNGNGTGTNGGNGAAGAGTLQGSAQGYGGEVTVTVTVDGDDIVSVEAVGEKETQGVGSKAIEELPDKIEEADSTDVEVVTGATVTSNAIKEAVDKALKDK